jgi:hypothetical protein
MEAALEILWGAGNRILLLGCNESVVRNFVEKEDGT